MFKNLTFISLIFILSSCAATYVPNVISTPLLKEKNDFSANLIIGTNGTDAQISYAPTSHIGIMLNSSFAHKDKDLSKNYNNRAFVEVATGYYLPFSKNMQFEIYGGGGYGIFDGQYNYTFITSQEDKVSGSYSRVFIQPTLAVTTPYFEGAFSARVLYLNSSFTYGRSLEFVQLNTYFVEPVFTIKSGYKNIFGHVQAGVSVPYNQNDNLRWRPFIFNMGITYRVNFKKKI